MARWDGIVDYSAWREFKQCSASWYEKYINRRVRPFPPALRDDALCLGSLVHEGLRVWQLTHTVEIPPKIVEEMTPSPETLNLALELVWGYAKVYPEERWPLILCEEPLLFPLTTGSQTISACPTCGQVINGEAEMCGVCGSQMTTSLGDVPLRGLAKLDAYFYVPEPYIVESGQPGLQFTLTPGWWVHEYKTKSPDVSLPLFIQKWEMNMQASFQVLALQHWLTSTKDISQHPQREALIDGLVYSQHVQGVLVNVLEKPKKYVPRRKCKSCEESYEYATWIPTGAGEYHCPVCGAAQKLTPLKENPTGRPPAYYRIVVHRSESQLAKARRDIIQVGERMQAMSEGGLESEEWNTENCTQYKKACQYFSHHLTGESTLTDITLSDVRDYRELPLVS